MMKRTLGKLAFFRTLLTALALSVLVSLMFPGLAQAADPEELDSTPSSAEAAPTAETSDPTQVSPSAGTPAISTPVTAPLSQTAPAPAPAATKEIASFADLEPYLELKTLTNDCKDPASREVLTLKPGNYKLTKDFQIDPTDSYFADKKQLVKYGLINIDGAVTFDGNGRTISFPAQDAFPLFGRVATDKFTISNLKLKYAGDVDGFPFAMELGGGRTLTDQGFVAASGKVENIEVTVAGNVNPLPSLGKVRCSINYSGNYQGVLSTGFTWFADDTNFDNLKIDIKGNIGSETAPESEDASAGAFGFTFHFGNTTPQQQTNDTIDHGKTWQELYVNRNPQVLQDTGHLKNLNLQVGGNIQAVTKNAGYAAGIGFDMGEAWIDNAQINIAGDINVDMQGSKPYPTTISAPLAAGISEEVQNFTNSQLQVKNIIFKSNPAIPQKTGSGWNYTRVHGLADDNSKGNYLNVKNNTIKIAEKMQVESSMWILSSAGFMNAWNSVGGNGVDDLQVYEDNTYQVGEIELKGTGTGDIFYAGLAMKARTGKETNSAKPSPLPEVSGKNNKLTCGNFKIENPRGDVDAQLMMYNLANAKGNSVTYGDISVSASNLDFSGLGHLLNSEPKENFYPQLTADNHFKAGNIDITAKTAGTVALMFGSQDKDQPAKKCSAQAKSFNVTLTDAAAEKPTYIGGLTAFGQSDIKDSRIAVGDVKVASASQKNLYFGLGAARAQNTTHSGNTVFVDKNIEVNHAGSIYGGGYGGFLRDFSIDNSHLQVDGVQKVDSKGDSYGGFAGQINNTTITNSSALLLNDYQPFVFLAKGGELDRVAHYINKAVPTYYSGLLGGHYGDQPMVVKNSTLLVEKDHTGSPLFRTANVAAGSENNYLTVVNDPNSKLNRTAYRTAATQISEDGKEVEVMAKTGEPVGSIQIAKRSFQDKYWNTAVQDYQTGSAEASFKYMVKDSSEAKLKVFALPAGIVTDDASTGKLSDYFSRHAGIVAENGPAYDLLGINAFATPDTPETPGQPGQPETPEQPGNPNPGKPSPQGDSQQMPPTGSYELLSLLLSGALMTIGAGLAYSRKRANQH